MRGMQAGGDGACADSENLRNAPVVKICVVAKKQNETLTLRKRGDESCKLQSFFLGRTVSVHHERRCVGIRFARSPPPLLSRRIDHSTPDPSFERRFTAEVTATPHNGCKGILDSFSSALSLAHDRGGDRHEVAKPLAVERLDLGQEIFVVVRHFLTVRSPATAFC